MSELTLNINHSFHLQMLLSRKVLFTGIKTFLTYATTYVFWEYECILLFDILNF